MNVQIIEHDGTPEYAVIPYKEWQAMADRLEELQDLADARGISRAITEGEETFHHEFAKRLCSSESPLKVWREYRGFTLAGLATKCSVTPAAISQIETGKRSPSVELLLKFSRALDCDMDDLIKGNDGQDLHLKFRQALAKVPDVEPEAFDRL